MPRESSLLNSSNGWTRQECLNEIEMNTIYDQRVADAAIGEDAEWFAANPKRNYRWREFRFPELPVDPTAGIPQSILVAQCCPGKRIRKEIQLPFAQNRGEVALLFLAKTTSVTLTSADGKVGPEESLEEFRLRLRELILNKCIFPMPVEL